MKSVRSQSGASTIVVTLLLLFAITALTIAGLSAASSNLKITRNYRTGTQALLAAEAAKIHAHEMISDWGIIRFNNDILPFWSQIYGSGWREMPGYPGVRYKAEIWEDPDDRFGHLMMKTTGQAPGESTRIIQARLEVDLEFSPGAIYLPNDVVDPTFNGNNFMVDGFDRNLDGTRNPDGDVPGITTRNKDSKDAVVSELSAQQQDNVIGDGGDPAVQLSYGPTAERVRTEIVPNILAQPNVHPYPAPYKVNGKEEFGTVENPQITYFAGELSVMANGNASGAGIMVVDGPLKINGNLNFTGLIIVRGTTTISTNLSGNAVMLGAIWTTNLGLTVAGSASITYSTEAMQLAGSLGVDLLPKRARSVAWKEL